MFHLINFNTCDSQLRPVCLQLLAKTMCGGGEIVCELLSNELSVPPGKLLAATRGRASNNSAAMCTLKAVYPQMPDIGRCRYTIDCIGEHFVIPYDERVFRKIFSPCFFFSCQSSRSFLASVYAILLFVVLRACSVCQRSCAMTMDPFTTKFIR